MNEVTIIFLTFSAGFVLGTFFFAGLWWTVKRCMHSKYSSVWFIGSLIIRLGATIIGFYAISVNHWERILICLLGFILARALVTRFTQVTEVKQN